MPSPSDQDSTGADPDSTARRRPERGTGRSRPRLGRDAWVNAAAEALFRCGPLGVAVEPLAAALAVTKGSFYWHFSSRAELLTAALAVWERRATTEVIAANEAGGGSARERLLRLLHRVTSPRSGGTAEVRLLAAAPSDEVIAAALTRVVGRRLDYVTDLLIEAGAEPADAPAAAGLLYAAYVGAVHLAVAVPGAVPGLDAEATGRLMLDGLLDGGRSRSAPG